MHDRFDLLQFFLLVVKLQVVLQVHDDEKPGVNNFPSLQAASNVTPNKTPKTSSFKKLSQKERRKLQSQKEDERTPVAIGDETKQINAKVQQPWY